MPLIVADLVGRPDAPLVYRAITAGGRRLITNARIYHLPQRIVSRHVLEDVWPGLGSLTAAAWHARPGPFAANAELMMFRAFVTSYNAVRSPEHPSAWKRRVLPRILLSFRKSIFINFFKGL
jgi:hypothetical protein